MFLPIFVAFGFVLNLSQSTEHQGDIIAEQHVTGVLGEEVYLHCLYTGNLNIRESSWKHQERMSKWPKAMAGYRNGKPFALDYFYTPASLTNLTVKLDIKSIEAEGVYTCLFSSEEYYDIINTVTLSVIVRPHVSIHAEEEVLNGTHYQSISCTSSHAKPKANLHWDIHGLPPREDIFSIHNTDSILPNGTHSIVSMLRFPIHLNNESSVACVIQHPAWTEPSTTVINLQTFVSPNVTMEVALTEKKGKAFFEVICKAKGGRPHPSLTWIQTESADTSCSAYFVKFELVSSSHCFPLDVYEGKNITCAFGYPFHAALERTVTLPTYSLTSLHLRNSSIKMDRLNTSNLLILKEEDSDIKIGIEVLGNVPRYEINCTKDGEPLSEYVYVNSSGLLLKGPVGANHTGIYQCEAFYYKHTASLQFEIDVKTRVREPAPIKVTLTSNTSWENGIEYSELKCIADNVSPGANITWETGNCSNGISASKHGNVVSGHEEDSGVVWNTARLPLYSYAGCTIICEVQIIGLEKPVQKSIDIPLIEPPRSHVIVSLQSDSTHWIAVCKSVGAISNISWVISDTNFTAEPLAVNKTIEGNKMQLTCIYKFNLMQHEGQFLTCVIQNVYGEIRRTIHVPHFVITSIVVINKTIPLHGSHAQHTGLHRVALKKHVSNQRIIFKVNGNASAANIKCFRPNGLSAQTEGLALVFLQQVSESDAGLYTCISSWSNHNASVTVLVEVTSQEIHSMMIILICFSSAVAITLILMVVLCIFCKRNEEAHCSNQNWKKRESLAALMQDPRSPEVKKARGQGQEYAELVHYSIVIDVKSTV